MTYIYIYRNILYLYICLDTGYKSYDTPVSTVLSTAKYLLNACFKVPWIEGILHVHAI